MPLTRCDIHGLTYAHECCVHIADAVDHGRFERAHIELNGWAEPGTVCDRCREQTHAQREAARAAGTRGWFFELEPGQHDPCGEHVAAWYAATGQGDHLGAIGAARAAAGVRTPTEDDP